MQNLLEAFSYEFMQRGLLTAFLLSIGGGLLGNILVLRRLALMGDALSHSLLPGIAIAYLIFGTNTPALFAGALIAGLLTAVGGALLSRTTRIKEDAAFGSLFVILFALGIALISLLKTRVDLLQFLFGNILAVSPADLRLTAFITLLTLVILAVFRRPILLESFDPVFHRATGGHGTLTHLLILALVTLNLVAALQSMGVILALGLFLLPATTAHLWSRRLRTVLILSIVIAAVGSFVGILSSYYLGIASGASIVLAIGTLFLLSVFLKNILPQLFKKLRQNKIRHPGHHHH